jgi:hypothetical protein
MTTQHYIMLHLRRKLQHQTRTVAGAHRGWAAARRNKNLKGLSARLDALPLRHGPLQETTTDKNWEFPWCRGHITLITAL